MNSLKWFTSVVVMLLAAAPVFARDADLASAPKQNGWIVILASIVLIVLAGAGAFLWSKRGHHD